jgi:hypothetical protein
MKSFPRPSVVWLILFLGTCVLACGDSGVDEAVGVPDRPAVTTGTLLTGTSAQGLYQVELWPREGKISLQQLHEWVIRIRDASGEVVIPPRVAIDGGMPQHGHGLVTRPRVTGTLPNGDLLIEGMKFHMGGAWTLRVEIAGPEGADIATFEVQVGP